MYKFVFISFLYSISIGNLSAQHINPVAPKTIRFVENKGQWESTIAYRTDLPGGKLFAEKNKLTYVFYDTKILADVHDRTYIRPTTSTQRVPNEELHEGPIMNLHAFSVSFLGATTNATITNESPNPERTNFFIGNDPKRWASNVQSFNKINYKSIYPSIDLSVYEYQQNLKYEFVLAAGVDPSIIALQYSGTEKLFLEYGHLHIKTSVNEITENAPYIYQLIEGKEIKIKGSFVLKDSTVRFSIGNYNKKYPLIIDPQLIFSTYSGSVADNWGNTAAFDEAGNMYSGGTVFHVGFPATVGAYQQNFAGGIQNYGWGIDVGILKYNPTGTGLIYATYLGGFRTDVPYSLIVNNNDELVIFGSTSSVNFPTAVLAYDKTYNGGNNQTINGMIFANGSDLFVTKLNSSGSTLLGSTYIGGSENDGLLYSLESLTKNYGDELRGDVTVDDLNNIYVASNTRSFNFPVTLGAMQPTFSGGFIDACTFKLSSDLSTLLWSTYVGGTNDDAAYSIQVDSVYNVFVGGGTTSTDFPITTGSLHTAKQGGIDGFVSHINFDGTSIINSTYIGTTAYDQVYFVQLDSLENVYLLGQTRGTYPVTAGTYNNPNSGQFIHKLSRDLSTSLMSTVIGSGDFNPNISLTAFLVNDCGNIFLSGWGGENNQPIDPFTNQPTGYVGGYTSNMPITADAYQPISKDSSDFYIMALGKDASTLLYATYFGGDGSAEHVDGGTSRFDKKGIIYQSVCAGCGGNSLFPTWPKPGAYSNTNKSNFWENGNFYQNCNNGSFKFDLVTLKADFDFTKIIDCSNNSVSITNTSLGGKSYFWDFGDSKFSTNPGPLQHTYSTSGTYTITLIATDFTTCIGKDTIAKQIIIPPPPPPIVVNTKDTTLCKGDSVALMATNNASFTYLWSPPTYLNNATIYNPMATPDQSIDYSVTITDTNNCIIQRKLFVEVIDLKKGLGFNQEPDCEGKNKVTINNSTVGKALNYHWFFSDGFSVTTTKGAIEHEYTAFGAQTVYLDIESNGCNFKDTLSFVLEKVFIPNLVTPNEDGQNDYFAIQGIGKGWTVELFNRWGKRIYKDTNYQNSWSGIDLSDDVYYFLIISPNEKKCKGWVEILR